MIADFKIVQRGYWLQGAVIAEFTEAGLQDCYGYCLHNPSCKSFNIGKYDYGTCQLNSMSSHDVVDNTSLTANENWNFHSTNFSEQMVILMALYIDFTKKFQKPTISCLLCCLLLNTSMETCE